ncbi:MAG TPA: hypothetical protein VGF01_11880 [Terracidiphilus sp.]|jgi:hypothetical protein
MSQFQPDESAAAEFRVQSRLILGLRMGLSRRMIENGLGKILRLSVSFKESALSDKLIRNRCRQSVRNVSAWMIA